jgi:hypothetical protein
VKSRDGRSLHLLFHQVCQGPADDSSIVGFLGRRLRAKSVPAFTAAALAAIGVAALARPQRTAVCSRRARKDPMARTDELTLGGYPLESARQRSPLASPAPSRAGLNDEGNQQFSVGKIAGSQQQLLPSNLVGRFNAGSVRGHANETGGIAQRQHHSARSARFLARSATPARDHLEHFSGRLP